jgi:hypothetical protein
MDIHNSLPDGVETTADMLLHVHGVCLFKETTIIDSLNALMSPSAHPKVQKRVEYKVSGHLVKRAPGPH